jgi:uncharacterized membrane protein YeaQ/YmgE (transglycosylase-associated protein family)
MIAFPEIALGPDHVIGWVVVGLTAGLLVAFVTKGGRYGLVGDAVAGLAGAVLGGVLFGLFTPASTGVGWSILVAFLGACVSVALLRIVVRRGTKP